MRSQAKCGDYSVSIEGDPMRSSIGRCASSAKWAAFEAAPHAKVGEVITVVGPRGGVTKWRRAGLSVVPVR
jgi:hypothetical protein